MMLWGPQVSQRTPERAIQGAIGRCQEEFRPHACDCDHSPGHQDQAASQSRTLHWDIQPLPPRTLNAARYVGS